MTHAPKFWADKLPDNLRSTFWDMINHGYTGETAYCRLSDTDLIFDPVLDTIDPINDENDD